MHVPPATRIVETGGGPTVVHARTTDDVAQAVRNAVEHRLPLGIVAAGTWLTAHHPSTTHTQLNIRAISGILHYSPGDFTLTARASTPLDDITAAAAECGQWLPLDPFGSPAATLGATLATASCGPLASSIGLPRDNVLGLEIVTGDARIIRAGGTVVKNVAGFDLVRLNIGAWGTLGILTEATLRLRALPEVDRTLLVPLPASSPEASWWRQLRELPAVVAACEAFTGPLAESLGLPSTPLVALRLCGNARDVDAVETLVRDLGTPNTASPSFWADVRRCEPADARVTRYSALPSHFDKLWSLMATPGTVAHASVSRGIVRTFSGATSAEHNNATSVPFQVGIIVERNAPSTATSTSASHALATRVRDAFDPWRLLNPGIAVAT